jgi:hypothetical protein
MEGSIMFGTLHRKIAVLPGGRIEVTDQALPAGELVDVIILLPASSATPRRSAIDILAEAPGHRLFQTAADVDDYLQKEREWDR